MSPQILSDDRLSQHDGLRAGVLAPGPGPAFPVLEPTVRRLPLRFGWSIAATSAANVLLALITYVSGWLTIGLIGCTALSLASMALVMAELFHRRRVALGEPVPPPKEREPFFRPW